MKQITNKIFTGCPYEKKKIENCSKCPRYQYCLKMKRDIIRRRLRFLKGFIIIASALLLITVCLIICIGGNNRTETDNNSEPTTETTQLKAELSAYGPSDTYYYNVSDEDKLLIAKVVYAESRGEPFEGQVAVAAVVLNRFRFNENIWDFENESISSLIFQKNQFASISGVTMEDLEEYPNCIKAVEDACKGWDPTRVMFSNGALYFYDPDRVTGKEAEIREGIKVFVIGTHNFHYDFEKVVEE